MLQLGLILIDCLLACALLVWARLCHKLIWAGMALPFWACIGSLRVGVARTGWVLLGWAGLG